MKNKLRERILTTINTFDLRNKAYIWQFFHERSLVGYEMACELMAGRQRGSSVALRWLFLGANAENIVCSFLC